MEDILLDDDGNFVQAKDGDVETVQDLECVLQDAKHRIMTFPGDIWAHPDEGVGLQRFIQAEDTEINRLEIAQLIKTKLALDDRIDPLSIKVFISSWERDKINIRVTFLLVPTAFDDPEEIPETEQAIVLTISQDGISLGGS